MKQKSLGIIILLGLILLLSFCSTDSENDSEMGACRTEYSITSSSDATIRYMDCYQDTEKASCENISGSHYFDQFCTDASYSSCEISFHSNKKCSDIGFPYLCESSHYEINQLGCESHQ